MKPYPMAPNVCTLKKKACSKLPSQFSIEPGTSQYRSANIALTTRNAAAARPTTIGHRVRSRNA